MNQKLSLIISLLFISQIAFAQTNTLPTTGNVGLGTTAPTMKLEVVGDTKLDGKLEIKYEVLVKDCMTVKKKLKIEEDIKVMGKSVFDNNGKFKSDLKVLGVAKMKDMLVVDGLTKMNGDAKVFGDFKIKSLEDPTLTTNRLISINPNGKVVLSSLKLPAIGPGQLVCAFTSPWAFADGTSTDRDIKLCHIFNSVTVDATFSVFKKTSIGTTIDNDVQLNIQNVNNSTGIKLFNVNTAGSTPKKYGIKNYTSDNDFITYSVTNPVSEKDVFRVMGDGHVWCTELDIKLREDFPDYVFANDYSLMPLDELENYIAKNKHLPNIPSAQDVAENGLSVGKMQVKQMEKIEELTLYLLEIKKELDTIKKENKELKQLILKK